MNAFPVTPSLRPAILVVEDSLALRSIIVRWLSMKFPECVFHSVASGEEALRHVLGTRTDIVLMDINLPGMSGLEATSRIKGHQPTAAVAMLTLYDTPSHREAARRAGADAYVPKQDMDAQLEPTVASLLRSREGKRA